MRTSNELNTKKNYKGIFFESYILEVYNFYRTYNRYSIYSVYRTSISPIEPLAFILSIVDPITLIDVDRSIVFIVDYNTAPGSASRSPLVVIALILD